MWPKLRPSRNDTLKPSDGVVMPPDSPRGSSNAGRAVNPEQTQSDLRPRGKGKANGASPAPRLARPKSGYGEGTSHRSEVNGRPTGGCQENMVRIKLDSVGPGARPGSALRHNIGDEAVDEWLSSGRKNYSAKLGSLFRSKKKAPAKAKFRPIPIGPDYVPPVDRQENMVQIKLNSAGPGVRPGSALRHNIGDEAVDAWMRHHRDNGSERRSYLTKLGSLFGVKKKAPAEQEKAKPNFLGMRNR